MKKSGKGMIVFIVLGVWISASCFGQPGSAPGGAAGSQGVQAVEAAVREAKSFQKTGDFVKAIEILEKALAESKKLSVCGARLECLLNLADLYWLEKKIDESAMTWKAAYAAAQNLGEKQIGEKCETALSIIQKYRKADALYDSEKYDEALECLREAVRLAKKVDSLPFELKCLRRMSLIYYWKKDYSNYLGTNKEALKNAQVLNSLLDQKNCFYNIGFYYYYESNYSSALNCYEEASKIDVNKYKDNDPDIFANIALVFMEIGDYKKALDYMSKSLKLDQGLNNYSDIVRDLNSIGVIYRKKGSQENNNKDIITALNYYYRSLEIAEKFDLKNLKFMALNNVGLALMDLNDLNEAENSLRAALKLTNDADLKSIGNIYCNLGNVLFLKKDLVGAIFHFMIAINKAINANSDNLLWETCFGLGQCYEKKNNIQLALMYYKKAIEAIDRIRGRIVLDTQKASFIRNKQRVYEALINLLASGKNNDSSSIINQELFVFVEKAKARAFMDVLSVGHKNAQDNNIELKEEEKEISKKITRVMFDLSENSILDEKRKALLRQLDRLEEEYMNVISKKRLKNPQTESLVSSDICLLSKVQNNLPDEKTAVVEYFLGEKVSLAFIITKNYSEWRILPPKKDIENSLKAYIKYISSPSVQNVNVFPASQRIYKQLLSPLCGENMSGIDRLIVIPDGILYFLPFETLIPSGIKKPSERDYLINKMAVSYAPSCSSLSFLVNQKKDTLKSKGLLAFGNPVNSPRFSKKGSNSGGSSDAYRDVYLNQGFEFSPLPHARKEVKSIARFFKKAKKDIYLGKKACEESVKMLPLDDYRIVHFACHGLLDEENPSRSALVLSVNEKAQEDGFLQVREIYNLKLNADLVVMSACQTGKGRMESGEGVMGLPRIFFYTGAKSVISALWKISDRSTSLFMERFYLHLAEGKEKTEALRSAKLDMLKTRYSHPFHWAAFVLNGEYKDRIDFN